MNHNDQNMLIFIVSSIKSLDLLSIKFFPNSKRENCSRILNQKYLCNFVNSR